MHRACVAILCVLLVSWCCSFTTTDTPCMDLFNRAFGKMKNLNAPSNKGLSLKYVVTVQTIEGDTYTDNIDLNIYNKRASIISSDVTIYQDDKTMVAIRPESNTIFMTKPANETLRRTKFQDIIKMQDSIFSKMVLKSCILETSGSPLKKLTFRFPSNVQNKIGIESAIYWIDEHKSTIKKLQLNYAAQDAQRLQTWSMEFLHIDTQYAKLPFEGSALSKVYDSRNSLKPSYENYSVIDKR